MRAGPAYVLLLLIAVLGVRAALADGPSRALLTIDPCIEVDQDQVRQLFAIELGAQLVSALAPDAALLSVRCSAAGAELRVEDPATGKALVRFVDLGALPARARPRLLALALAELLFTSWSEPEVSPAPGPPRRPAERMVRAVDLVVRRRSPAVLTRARPLRLMGLLSGQEFRGTGLLLGGGLRLSGDYGHQLGFSADLLGHHGQSQVPLGSIAVDTVSAGAGLLVRMQLWRLDLHAGAGLRGGAARLSGEPRDPKGHGATLWGPFGGPMALLGVGVTPHARMVVEFLVEGGYVVLPVTGRAGAQAVAVAGPWLAAQLGVGLRP